MMTFNETTEGTLEPDEELLRGLRHEAVCIDWWADTIEHHVERPATGMGCPAIEARLRHGLPMPSQKLRGLAGILHDAACNPTAHTVVIASHVAALVQQTRDDSSEMIEWLGGRDQIPYFFETGSPHPVDDLREVGREIRLKIEQARRR